MHDETPGVIADRTPGRPGVTLPRSFLLGLLLGFLLLGLLAALAFLAGQASGYYGFMHHFPD